MKNKVLDAKIVEPQLKHMFDEINNLCFGGKLECPPSLAYNFKLRTSAGRFVFYDDTGVWYIEIMGRLKNAEQLTYYTLAHEMTHAYCFLLWFNHFKNLSMGSFINDDSTFFIVELTRVAQALGSTYSELAECDARPSELPQNKTTQEAYVEVAMSNDILMSL
jgi:hypothetical protein